MTLTLSPEWIHHRARVAALSRDRCDDDPDLQQARRALALARTEARVAEAIAEAPPLDPVTIAKLHALIPPAPNGTDPPGGTAAALPDPGGKTGGAPYGGDLDDAA